MVSLGVDVGGTGCKCVAFSERGVQLAMAYAEYPVEAGTDRLPPKLLTECVFRVIGQCAAQVEDEAVITVSSFGESFVPLDEKGEALTDILLYYGDGRNEAFEQLVEAVGKQKIAQIARVLPDASYSLAKMLLTKQAAKFLFVAGFLAWKLSGVMATDVSLACRSMLYDVEHGCWSEELVTAAGLRMEQLPEVLPAGTCLGDILPCVASELGLPETVKIVLGAHDQIAGALGAGVQQHGDAVDICGTCECLTPMFGQIPAASFTEHNFACVPYFGGFVTYAYNISAGSVVRWYRDTFGVGYGEMNETCPEHPTELLVLPFLQGMGGTPDVDPGAVGTVLGLTTKTRLPELYRAMLEGITLELRYNMELLAKAGIKVERIFAAGGGARSMPWLQVKADILNCAVTPVAAEETGALGSAILGFSAVTGEDAFAIAKRSARYGAAILPKPEHTAIYEEKYKTYTALRRMYMESRR